MAKIVIPKTKADLEAAATAPLPNDALDETSHYRTSVVVKPWGYEYLALESKSVAVWCLVIYPNQSTSLHCHKSKDTVLRIIDGEGTVKSLHAEYKVASGDVLFIEKGSFHQTISGTNNLVLLEAESPVNKQDLLRVADAYGRRGQGYERVSTGRDLLFRAKFPRTKYIYLDELQTIDHIVDFSPVASGVKLTLCASVWPSADGSQDSYLDLFEMEGLDCEMSIYDSAKTMLDDPTFAGSKVARVQIEYT